MRWGQSLRYLSFVGICVPMAAGLLSAQTSPAISSDTRHNSLEQNSALYASSPGAKNVGAQECQACHQEAFKGYQIGTHALSGASCESCHGPGSLHVQDQDKHEGIFKFKKRTAKEANGVCLSCHARSSALMNWSKGPHRDADLRCTECHSVHAAETGLPTRLKRTQACTRCHKKQEQEVSLPYHHPVQEGKMDCVDCHNSHGGAMGNNLHASSVNQLCFECHAEFQGPYTYQHAPVTESCLICHKPHGSMNKSLLKVSQPLLCLQCHSAHHNGSGIPLLNACTNCHTSIHGSDVPSVTGGSDFIDKL